MTVLAYQPPANERLIWGCVAASLLLHAMLMWRMHGVEPAAPMVQEFKATIRSQAPPARPAVEPPKPEAVAPEPPKPEPPKLPEPVSVPKPTVPSTIPAVSPKATPVERKAAPVVPAAAQPQPASATPTPAVPAPTDSKSDAKADAKAVAAAPPAVAGAAAAPSSSELKAVIQSYELQLAQAAQKYKLYPSEAMEQKWEGTAQIMVHIGADGRISGIDLVSSTGHDLLDEQAKKTAQKAKPFVQIPPQLKGQPFDAQIRVVFTLKQ